MDKGKVILVVKEKHVERYIDIGNSVLENAAYVDLFKERYKEGLYVDLVQYKSALLEQAKAGDPVACRKFINLRAAQGYEYESVQVAYLEVAV